MGEKGRRGKKGGEKKGGEGKGARACLKERKILCFNKMVELAPPYLFCSKSLGFINALGTLPLDF